VTKVVLFYPTAHFGGIDVLESNLERQTVKPDVILVADMLYREEIWLELASKGYKIQSLEPTPILRPYKRNLAREYNRALSLSFTIEADLMLSLQSYIWIPNNGIERFVKIHEANPNALITGITDISKDPRPTGIKYPNGLYTIFPHAYVTRPNKIDWWDSRREVYDLSDGDLFPIFPEHWEANWAAVPVDKFKQGCKWDEDFDKGIAYENMDFAKTCVEKTACEVLLDARNESISLPHKDYFPGEREEIEQYSNRWRYEAKWGI
jgi:hypothetical protein